MSKTSPRPRKPKARAKRVRKKRERVVREYVGVPNVVVVGEDFNGAATLLRFVECPNYYVASNTFANPNADGEEVGDGAGHCIQSDKSTGIIEDNIIDAGDGAEDLISIYGDRKVKGEVIVRRNKLRGRGTSESSTSIIVDGLHPPKTTITDNDIDGARVGIQLAGGNGHVVEDNRLTGCEHDVEIHGYYPKKKPRPVTGFTVRNSGRVNVGKGSRGTVNGKRVVGG